MPQNKVDQTIPYDSALRKFADLLTPKNLKGFAEEPVPLDVFIYDKNYLGCFPLSTVQYDFVAAATNIFNPPTFTECVALWGKRGGKDFVSRVSLSRIIYLLECLNSPSFYFGLQPNSPIEVMNVAVNAEQASRVFFNPFKEMIKNSPYFRKIGFNETRYTIDFPKNISAFSGNSEQEGLEGHTLIAVVFDEIAGFPISDSIEGSALIRQRDARTLYNSLRSSTLSFPGIGKAISLSWPRYDGDFIMQLVESKKDDPSAYVSAFVPTWVANPKHHREDFDDEYRKDPINAAAKFECKPLKAQSAWITNTQIIDDVFKITPNVYDSEYRLTNLVQNQQYQYVAHIDLGLRHDASGIAVVHCEEDGKVSVDYTTFLVAPPGGEVSFDDIYAIIRKLMDKVRLVSVTMDSWQSAEMLQNIKKLRMTSDVISADRTTAPYDTLKELIYTNKLYCEFRDDRLVRELKELQVIRGQKVEHPKCFTGDTKISLLNGQEVCIKDLVGVNSFWVYSFDGAEVVAGYGHNCIKTGSMIDVYEVTLDNGEKIKVTKDHPFMLRDGAYCSINQLKSSDSLMPLYRKIAKHRMAGYELYYEPIEGRWHYTHTTISAFRVYVKRGYIRHHIDFNRRNNEPTNITVISRTEHTTVHGTSRGDNIHAAYEKCPEKWNNSIAGLKKANANQSLERRKKQGQKLSVYRRNLPHSEQIERAKYVIEYSKNHKVTREKRICAWCNNEFEERPKRRRKFCSKKCYNAWWKENIAPIGWKIQNKKYSNHKIINIAYVGKEDVYDFKVDDYHNFALTAGVFVHNSGGKDLADSLACAVWNAVKNYPFKKRFYELADVQEMLITGPERASKLQPQQQGSFILPKWPEQVCMFCRKKDEVVILDTENKKYFCRRCNTQFGNL